MKYVLSLILILVASEETAAWEPSNANGRGWGDSKAAGSSRDSMGTGANCFFCGGNPTNLGRTSGSGGTAGTGGGFWSGSGNGGWGWD